MRDLFLFIITKSINRNESGNSLAPYSLFQIPESLMILEKPIKKLNGANERDVTKKNI